MKLVSSNIPQIISMYPRHAELEECILQHIVRSRGIKETELWLQVIVAMQKSHDAPSPCIISGTIQRMIRQRRIIGIDYTIGGYVETFLLPPKAEVEIINPIKLVKTSRMTVLQGDE